MADITTAPTCYGCEHCGCDPDDPESFCRVCFECDIDEDEDWMTDWELG